MSQRLPVDGVRLVLEGERQFIRSLTRVDSAWQKTAQGFDKASSSTSKANTGLNKLSASSLLAGTDIMAIAGGAAIVVAGLNVLVKTIQKVTGAIGSVIAQSVQLAGEFQEMEFVSLAIGRAMGLTEPEIRGASEQIQELGIRADVANRTVAQFARNQLDLAKATELVRIAQATGIIVNEDSSATMASLTRAITTGATATLRRMGIMLDNADVEERFARSIGKTVDQLTQQQRMLARTNAIIEQGANLLDVYDAAMESPTKRMRSLTGRILPEMQAALGAPFLDAWSTVIKSVSDFAVVLTEAMQEGGALFPWLIRLGAVASIMADGFASAMGKITNLITGMSSDVGMGVSETINEATSWGVELIAAFAEGMVEASTTVLIQAMNFISDILSSWLLGASPPKVAPGIMSWGISLMDQYLRGMTQADFDILKAVQGPLKKVLEGPAFADISKALAGMLAGGDTGGFLETVGKTAGIFGDAIRQMAEANLDLAASVTDVEEAEKALAKSRQKILDSQAAVNQATIEYNRLLREGASADILAVQMAQINASEDNLHTAMDQVDIQKDTLSQAKERKDQLEEEAKLQKNVVDQLLLVNDALTEKEKAEQKALKGPKGAKALRPLGELPIPTDFDISSRIGDAIDAMKKSIKEKFADVFKPLTDAFANMKRDLDAVGEKWDAFKETVGLAWDELKKRFPILQRIETFVTAMPGKIAEQGGAWEVFKKGVLLSWAALKEKFPTLQAIEKWTLRMPDHLKEVRAWFRDKLPPAIEKMTGVLWKNEDSLYNAWKELLGEIKSNFWPFIRDTLWPKLLEFTSLVLTPLLTGLLEVIGAMESWKRALGEIWEVWREGPAALTKPGGAFFDIGGQLEEAWKIFIGESPAPLAVGLKSINDQLQVLATTRLPALASMSSMGGALAPMQQLSPVSNTNVTMNMGGNTFNGPTDNAAFDTRVQQSLRRQLRK